MLLLWVSNKRAKQSGVFGKNFHLHFLAVRSAREWQSINHRKPFKCFLRRQDDDDDYEEEDDETTLR